MNNIAIKPLNEHTFSHKKCCLHEIEALLIIMIINCSLMSKINMHTIIADWSIPNKCINKHLNGRFDLNKWICNWEIQIIVSFRRRISNKCVGCYEWVKWKCEKKIPRKIMALETVELNWIIFSELQKKVMNLLDILWMNFPRIINTDTIHGVMIESSNWFFPC